MNVYLENALLVISYSNSTIHIPHVVYTRGRYGFIHVHVLSAVSLANEAFVCKLRLMNAPPLVCRFQC